MEAIRGQIFKEMGVALGVSGLSQLLGEGTRAQCYKKTFAVATGT